MNEPHDTSAFRLPQPPAPPLKPEAFVQCPQALLEGLSEEEKLAQRDLYEKALREACGVARPALPERDLLGMWN
jgi:hypothetical protein